MLGVSLRGGGRVCGPNKTELEFQREFLEGGEWKWWAYEAVVLRCTDRGDPIRRSYCPDFVAVGLDGSVVFYEVKGGFIRDRALDKPKWAAQRFRALGEFILAQRRRDGWHFVRL